MKLAADDLVLIVLSKPVKAADKSLPIQDFIIAGQSMIPFFTSDALFASAVGKELFPYPTIKVRFGYLIGLMKGDETLVANPGTAEQEAFPVAELAGDAGD